MRLPRHAAVAIGLLTTMATITATPATAIAGEDMHYNVVSGTPFMEITPNETGESPHLMNVSAWGFRADGEHKAIERSDDVQEDTFAMMLRWHPDNERHLECWGGQLNTSNLGWKELPGAWDTSPPTGCMVGADDLHRDPGGTVWAHDAAFHVRLNPQNGTEVFDHYERVQVAIFNYISIDVAEDQPRQIHQFTLGPADWDHLLDEAGLNQTTTTTQTAEPATNSQPDLFPVALGALVGLACLAVAYRASRRDPRR